MTLIRTPLVSGQVQLSSGNDGLYWKQVLPLDYKLNYYGTELNFDKKYITDVITAYKQNALGDPIAFQLADDENRHDTPEDEAKLRNHDPRRFRGSVKAMELRENQSDKRDNGLWCGFDLTADGKKLIDDNKELGVSASLSQGFDPKYPVIMRHVVGTIHPKIKNMPGWQRAVVSLSDAENPDEEVLDFMAEEKDDKSTKVEIDKDKLDGLMAYVEQKQKEDKELDDLLNSAANSVESEEVDEEDDEKQPQLANLSDYPEWQEMQRRVNLSETNAANEKWKRERSEFARQGVPKAILDLAEPIMSAPAAMNINLSDGNSADGKEAMRKMLNEAKGYVDLSEEEGFGRDPDVNSDEYKARKEAFETIYEDFTMEPMF